MTIPAKIRGICPECQKPIELGEMIAKASGRWVHANPCAEGKPPNRARKERQGSVEEMLEGLLLDVEETFPGCIGFEAEIEVRYFRTDYERVIATPWLRFEDPLEDVYEEDFRRRRRDLYDDACDLMEKLAIDCFDGEAFPDGVYWPDTLY